MKRLLIYLLCAVFALSCSKPAQPAPEPQQPEREDENGLAFAALSVINMREEPSYPAELGTQALMGTPLKVHYHDNDYWVNVETPDGYKAWVNDMAIVPIDQARLDAWKASKRVIVTNYYSFFVDAPKPGAQHVSDAVWGDIVEYVAPAGKYIKVKLPDGKEAFIPAADVMD
ncbi:MAG: SH3 domain-containing protein, partial [Bacteroidales bacterium]|nr:SH3 domain-containing protein [Bacteroidales bacterium]